MVSSTLLFSIFLFFSNVSLSLSRSPWHVHHNQLSVGCLNFCCKCLSFIMTTWTKKYASCTNNQPANTLRLDYICVCVCKYKYIDRPGCYNLLPAPSSRCCKHPRSVPHMFVINVAQLPCHGNVCLHDNSFCGCQMWPVSADYLTPPPSTIFIGQSVAVSFTRSYMYV